MSYAEPGWNSDVYVWMDGKTLTCEMGERPVPYTTKSHLEMHEHLLRDHRQRGHKVPQSALERLLREARALPALPYQTRVRRRR